MYVYVYACVCTSESAASSMSLEILVISLLICGKLAIHSNVSLVTSSPMPSNEAQAMIW